MAIRVYERYDWLSHHSLRRTHRFIYLTERLQIVLSANQVVIQNPVFVSVVRRTSLYKLKQRRFSYRCPFVFRFPGRLHIVLLFVFIGCTWRRSNRADAPFQSPECSPNDYISSKFACFQHATLSHIQCSRFRPSRSPRLGCLSNDSRTYTCRGCNGYRKRLEIRTGMWLYDGRFFGWIYSPSSMYDWWCNIMSGYKLYSSPAIH